MMNFSLGINTAYQSWYLTIYVPRYQNVYKPYKMYTTINMKAAFFFKLLYIYAWSYFNYSFILNIFLTML